MRVAQVVLLLWQPDTGLRRSDVELHDLEQVSVERESAAADSSLVKDARKAHAVEEAEVNLQNLRRELA